MATPIEAKLLANRTTGFLTLGAAATLLVAIRWWRRRQGASDRAKLLGRASRGRRAMMRVTGVELPVETAEDPSDRESLFGEVKRHPRAVMKAWSSSKRAGL